MQVDGHEVILRSERKRGGSDRVELAEALELLRSNENTIQVHVIGCLGWMKVRRQIGDYDCWIVMNHHDERLTSAPRSVRGGLDRAYREVLKQDGWLKPQRNLSRWKD